MPSLLNTVTDLLDDGIVCVDKAGIITLFNRKAQEIIGTAYLGGRSHQAGRIAPGDLVLIADNMLGEDDGDLTARELECIGLRDETLRPGDALLAVGIYQSEDNTLPVYRFSGPLTLPSLFSLETEFFGQRLRLSIDQLERQLNIEVNGEVFSLSYHQCMGHLVILDGVTGRLKFYQSRGCSLRHEDIGNLLRGDPFMAKGRSAVQPNLLGSSFFDLLLPGRLSDHLALLLQGEAPPMIQERHSIYKRPMLLSIHPLPGEDGDTEGAMLHITDLTKMDTLLHERNELIAKLEETQQNTSDEAENLPEHAFSTFVGSTPVMRQVKFMAYRAAQSRCNVILTGESGTGKSQLAWEIHNLSRPGTPFIEVNCASIPPNLFESELFGYVGGAFTGALSGGKAGYFEQAQGGTLFLDELAELPPDMQVKLLYVIQNKRFYRIGSTKPIDVDVRILCATNKNLRDEVAAGRFREDLFYRVNVFPIQMPPLRARTADIYLLSKSLTERTCAEYGLEKKRLSARALEKLLGYSWPGNIRELSNIIERAITVSDGTIIYPDAILTGPSEDTPPAKEETVSLQATQFPTVPPLAGRPLKELLAETEAAALRLALERHHGDKKAAMEELGVKKTVFYEKLLRYHIEV